MHNTDISERTYWHNLSGSSAAWAIANQARKDKALFVIAPDNLYAARLEQELRIFCANETDILHFPDWETLAYDQFSPHQDILSDRLATLQRANQMQSGIIISSISTIMHRLAPAEHLNRYSFLLRIKDRLNIDELRQKLTHAGYQSVTQVREHGEFAIRGSIIDLFPMGGHNAYRIDLFDDEIDSIQIFSTENQRSIERIEKIELLPAKEYPFNHEAINQFRDQWRSNFSGNPLNCPLYQDISEGIASPGIEYYLPLFFKKMSSIFDYLPNNTNIITIGQTQDKAIEFENEVKARYKSLGHNIERPILKPEQIIIPAEELNERIKGFNQILINANEVSTENTFAIQKLPDISINSKSSKPLSKLEDFVKAFDGRLLFCAESNGRREVLLKMLANISIKPEIITSWQAFEANNKACCILVAPIEESFVLEKQHAAIITENSLFGIKVLQRRLRKRSKIDPNLIIKDLSELKINDPIVHIDHGVGRYLGLKTLEAGNQLNEFITIAYDGGDKLYVPVSSLYLVSRYNGGNAESAPMSKLGSDQWAKNKKRAAEKARDVAAELLEIYAKRAALKGFKYHLDEEQYQTFASSFPFEETPDQLQAIEQIFTDMCSDKPMDRVICGDVGFGKTEVAVRAAYLAAANNKQAVLLVPTTLLAEQHFKTFQDRFADWPIQIEVLSRFKTGKTQEKILERVANGQVDILIGTHKIIQSNLKYKNLGLVIIDEEHRFGVKQKETLKALRSKVDILTMTATPIPRTLNMAFSGIRDLSIIATPPAKRLSVKTFVHEYNDHIIAEATHREIMRGGQVYFLHNDVATIQHKAEELSKILPDARIAIAHGQMSERELEQVMTDFYHRRVNFLLCSTIIESGIDIPGANTIIINRADKLGLAQLHQLRGRVGRSHHQAYAYMLTPPQASMTNDAKKRLDAIASLDDLGVGFTLATHDLEIRGTGELLGKEQSGKIDEVGFSLYMELLTRAIESLKSGKEPDLNKALMQHHTEVDLRLTALIPADYVNDVQIRLQLYKRIASAASVKDLDDLQVEMIDRFGLLPEAAKTLFKINELKIAASKIGICKIEANEKAGKFEFENEPNIEPEKIIMLLQNNRFKLQGPTKLSFTLEQHEPKDRINLIEAKLAEF